MSRPQPISVHVDAVYQATHDGDRLALQAKRGPARASAIARWTTLLLLFVLTLEITCRIDDWLRFRTSLVTPITSQVDLMVRDQDGIHGRPNARYQKWVMNAIGTRGPEVSFAKPAGTVRIVVLGASETFGLYESPGNEFPRQLEDTLRRWVAHERCMAAPVRIEVLNAALPGMSLPTIEQDVRNRVRRFEADAMVLYPTPAQYLDETPPQSARPDSSIGASSLPLWRALVPRFLQRSRDQLKALLPDVVVAWMQRRETAARVRAHAPGWRFDGIPQDRLHRYDADLRALIGSIRATGATPVLATHANAFAPGKPLDRHLLSAWEKFYPRATGDAIVAFDSAARLVTLSAAADSGVRTVDLGLLLSPGGETFFRDFSHFTDRGSAVVAGALAGPLMHDVAAHGSCGGAR